MPPSSGGGAYGCCGVTPLPGPAPCGVTGCMVLLLPRRCSCGADLYSPRPRSVKHWSNTIRANSNVVFELMADDAHLAAFEQCAMADPGIASWPLLWELRAAAQSIQGSEPGRAEQLARIAIALGEALAPAGDVMAAGFLAGTWVTLGRVRRLQGDLVGAAAAVGYAERYLHRSADPGERASFCRELAEIRLAEGRFEEALSLFERAACLFEDIGQVNDQVETLLAEGDLFLRVWDYKAALECFERVAIFIPQEIDAAAIFRAAEGAATVWMEQGCPKEARAALEGIAGPYLDRATPLQRVEILWTEARISLRCDRDETTTEAPLWEALDSFLKLSRPLLAASVALDLSDFYLRTANAESLERVLAFLRSLMIRPDLPSELRHALTDIAAEGDSSPLRSRLAVLGRRLARWRREPGLEVAPEQTDRPGASH
jgi:tetratricopeptide (TPR) repeat protein